MASSSLELRCTPQQARSRATMDRILKVGGELLDELGVEGFNTNILAARAGLGVRAIYRYFPNKLAVLLRMAEQSNEAGWAWIGDLSRVSEYGDWRAAVARSIDGYYRGASSYRGFAALRAAAHAIPELREMDNQDKKRLVRELAIGLRGIGISLDQSHLAALSRTIIESSERILDVAVQKPSREAKLLVRELKLMITNLLSAYLD
ncbi:MAG TPA: TetR/AcrR family transcriptional regulator [Candidatus Binataceae bacterium]|nr:TetR/AcrR family transcriptional regulator [Candidatus Binataceae bacterium]